MMTLCYFLITNCLDFKNNHHHHNSFKI
ncbi:unnamed protein product [Leptidea sinapis]|uniref:Uncharacterized protein n=1 Tax=Leptidea sinapis TaxID=189913 RepID=A0A5E4R4N4_9NEOP|nr:unnamed protein product [Leptidea sinapis]